MGGISLENQSISLLAIIKYILMSYKYILQYHQQSNCPVSRCLLQIKPLQTCLKAASVFFSTIFTLP